MGIPKDCVRFLLQARAHGVDFTRTLTLGRQDVLVGPERLEQILLEFGVWPPPQGIKAFQSAASSPRDRFESLAIAMGSRQVDSCDASDYEGATLLHDLNLPIPQNSEEQYDAVIDGGTLEHVFNFPVAIQNCMRLVKTGGTLFLFSPINNSCGHGFYQFSPELFYRVLCPANGFEIVRMIALENAWYQSSFLGVRYMYEVRGKWYAVPDPSVLRKRITLINRNSTIVLVQAQKRAHLSALQHRPQQSDYVAQWDAAAGKSENAHPPERGAVASWLLKVFGKSACLEILPRIAGWFDPFRLAREKRRHSFGNREFYHPQ